MNISEMALYDESKCLWTITVRFTILHQSFPFFPAHPGVHFNPPISFPRVVRVGFPQENPQHERKNGHKAHKQSANSHPSNIPRSVRVGIQSRSDKRAALADDIQNGNARSLAFLSDSIIHRPGNNQSNGGEKPGHSRVDADISDGDMGVWGQVGIEVPRGCDCEVGDG